MALSRFRLWVLLPVSLGALLALLWVRATGGASLVATLRAAQPALTALMLGVTTAWLLARFLRWQFLLRRAGIRLPIRPTLATYLAALPGTATPAYVGEAARAIFLRRRFRAPLRLTLAMLVMERLYDVLAIAILALAFGGVRGLRLGLLFGAVAIGLGSLLWPVFRRVGISPAALTRLRTPGTMLPALGFSLAAWGMAGSLYYLAGIALHTPVPFGAGAVVFSQSTLLGAVTLSPAGFGVTGSLAILELSRLGLPLAAAVALVTLVRLTSTGLALAIGAVFLWRELRSSRAAVQGAAHFDTIAEEYAAQWSPHVWDLLLDRKLSLMAAALPSPPSRAGTGIDLGCGLGIQTAEMRKRGFRVTGVEPSVGLLSQRRADGTPVVAGDALALPLATGSVDFLYVIGVLHHLPGVEAQARARAEICRVLRPGGRLLVHESNPRNPFFRFYMGYLFPLLKSIDEGTEWWIDPRRWEATPGMRLVDVRYFTFLPDFTPRILMGLALRVERWLERGPTRRYSAHYMAVLERVDSEGASI